jgi:hypothetical protein
MGTESSWALRALLATWAVSVLAVIGWWVVGAFGSDLGCEFAPGTSSYGESSLSVIPPGRTCTYSGQGTQATHVDAPDYGRVLVLGVAVGGGVALLADRRTGT